MFLRKAKRPWHSQRTKLNKPWREPEDIKTLLSVRGAGQQGFEGLLWGQRFWKPRPISYQAQDPRQGGRNVRGRTKKVRTAKRHCRGQFCSQQTKITKGESGMPPRAVSQSVLRESTGATRQLWENSGRTSTGATRQLWENNGRTILG